MSILIKPIITEKATDQSELSNCFSFVVKKAANKIEVKEAVEVATKLVDQFRGIRDEQQRLIVDNALLNKEMETQQKIAEDTNRTYEERKEALEKVGEAQVKYLKDHWSELRCNPFYMPMASIVGVDPMSNLLN